MDTIQSSLRRIRRWIILSATLLLVVGVAVLGFVPIDEKVRAAGTVVAEEEAYLYASAEGVIEEILAFEGTEVKAGAVILKIDTHDLEDRRDQLQAELKEGEAQVQLKQTQQERISKLPLPKDFWNIQTELVAAEQKARYAAAEHERYRQLFESKLTSESELAARTLADEMTQAELANVRDKVKVINAGLEQSITKEALADVTSALARVERLKIELMVCERDIARRSLRAPGDGKVTLLLKRRVGERVAKGEELVHLSRGTATRARLYVGEPQMHRVHTGQKVRLSTPIFSPLRYGYIYGHIEQVALEPTPQPVGEPHYLVKVQIDHSPMPLVLGASLNAEIILRRVPVWRLLLPAAVDKSEE